MSRSPKIRERRKTDAGRVWGADRPSNLISFMESPFLSAAQQTASPSRQAEEDNLLKAERELLLRSVQRKQAGERAHSPSLSKEQTADDDSVRNGSAGDHIRAALIHLCLALDVVKCSTWWRSLRTSAAQCAFDQNGVIYPNDPWKRRWDIMMMILILYSAAVVPFRIAFRAEADGLLWTLEASLSILFMLDVAFSFRTAFLVDGQWETRRWPITHRYLLGWFWIDAPSSMPLELLELLGTTSDMQGIRMLRALRLFRMLRLFKLQEMITVVEEIIDINIRVIRLFTLLFKIMLVAHLIGCGFFFLSWSSGEDEHWLNVYDEMRYGEAGVTEAGPTIDQYMIVIYWAVVTLTTVGYGDITPVNRVERTYATFTVLIGAMSFAYMIGEIGVLASRLDQQEATREEKLDEINQYLTWRGIPRDLSLRTRRYYEHYYGRQDIFDEQRILQNLNPRLRDEVISFILEGTIGKLNIFKTLSREFLLACFHKLRPCKYQHGDALCQKGEVPQQLYFMIHGEVEVLSRTFPEVLVWWFNPHQEAWPKYDPTDPQGHRCFEFNDFCGCFGQELLLGRRYQNTYRARTACETLAIRRSDLEELIIADPRSTRLILRTVLKDYERKDMILSIGSFMRIISLPHGELRCALFIQDRWRRWLNNHALKHDSIYRRMHESKSDSFVRRSSTRPALSSPASGRPTSTRPMFSSFQASSIVVDESLSEMGDSFGSNRSGTRSRTSEGQIVWA